MRIILPIIIFFLHFSTVFSQSADTSSFKVNTDLEIKIKKFDNPDIKIDGVLDEAPWLKSPRFGNFCEIEPHEKTKPSENTEVVMFYDEDNLYIGIICYDSDMTKVRKTLTDRDRIFSDDWAGIILDSYSESKQAYELFVNPLGIQGDLMWTAPGNEDTNFDAIWYSDAKLYKDRWTIEIAIPFKSIRFPNKKIQDWRLHILRTRPRENREQYSWVPVSRDDATLFTRYASLKGIENVKAGNNLEILPYTLGSQAGRISDFENSDSKFENEDIKGQVGVNVKYGITSNLTSDFTVNPDFSQIESDAGQIDVNNPYALYYNEKRPFFIEGSSIFNTPFNIVYTRAINNPLAAFKMTGKIGKYDIGYISAYDRNSPFVIPHEEGSDFLLTDRKSLSNILRLKRSINSDDSYIGFLLTDRQVNKQGDKFLDVDGYNRVFGIDGNYRFLENYSVTFQIVKYITKEINYTEYDNTSTFSGGKHTMALDGEEFSGFGNYIALNRSARHWNFTVDYYDASANARRDNGFMNANDFRKLETSQNYVFYPETKLFNRISPGFYAMVRHNTEGKLREEFFAPSVNLNFAKQIYLYLQFFAVNNEQFNGVYHQGARRFSLNLNVNTYNNLTWGAWLSMGKYIVRSSDPYIGWGYNLELWQTIKPIDRLTIENDWNYFEIAKNFGGEKLFVGYIVRNKSSLQIDKNFALRLITQYDSFSGNFNFNPLFSFKLNPFSIFYVGSTFNYDDITNSNGVPRYTLSGRQYFLKFQYLWRM
ncbi:MAG: carbohydrate binding family 9 domain-containing protein [Ignavibacteriae bacterium]|nr:carbohydrate binding family 9 domain-containing protein [Ignavibacteriota bacterium]